MTDTSASSATMEIYFCDLCNESVPASDLEFGIAFRRKGRVVCASCDSAMGGGATPASGAPLAQQPALSPGAAATHVRARPKGGVGVAVALGAGLVAMVLSSVLAAVGVHRFRAFQEEVAGRVAEVEQDSSKRERRAESLLTQAKQDMESQSGRLRSDLVAEQQELQQFLEELRTGQDSMTQRALVLETEVGRIGETTTEGLEISRQRLQALETRSRLLEEDLVVYGERLTNLQIALEAGALSPAMAGQPAAQGGALKPAWHGLLADLTSTNPSLRWEAVQALGETHDSEVSQHLLPMLQDVDVFVRMVTARVLGELENKSAIGGLIDALEDPELAVRHAAHGALVRISSVDLKFDAGASEADRSRRVQAWRDWWREADSDS